MRSIRKKDPPGVILWYRVYCATLGFLFLLCAGGGLMMVLFREELADAETESVEWLIMGTVLLIFGGVLAPPFALSFFPGRKPWVWIYGLVLIILGMTSTCVLPASIILLIYWVRAETRAYFGWDVEYAGDYDDADLDN